MASSSFCLYYIHSSSGVDKLTPGVNFLPYSLSDCSIWDKFDFIWVSVFEIIVWREEDVDTNLFILSSCSNMSKCLPISSSSFTYISLFSSLNGIPIVSKGLSSTVSSGAWCIVNKSPSSCSSIWSATSSNVELCLTFLREDKFRSAPVSYYMFHLVK